MSSLATNVSTDARTGAHQAPRARLARVVGPVIALAALLGACSDMYFDRRDPIALSMGDALESDKAAMIIDPWPPGSNNRNIPFNGQRMQAAAARYRNGRVYRPDTINTSSAVETTQKDQPQGGDGGGGGAGGAGGGATP